MYTATKVDENIDKGKRLALLGYMLNNVPAANTADEIKLLIAPAARIMQLQIRCLSTNYDFHLACRQGTLSVLGSSPYEIYKALAINLYYGFTSSGGDEMNYNLDNVVYSNRDNIITPALYCKVKNTSGVATGKIYLQILVEGM
jgi:hypothetical protein